MLPAMIRYNSSITATLIVTSRRTTPGPAEAMATARKIVKTTGNQPAWDEPSSSDPEFLVKNQEMSTKHEQKHGLWLAPGFYAEIG